MHGKYPRWLISRLEEDLRLFPAVALLGPRQVGKSTLARDWADSQPGSIYLDLESPGDQAKLTSPELFLDRFASRLVVLDEVQTRPDLFPILLGLIDRNRT